MLTKSQKMNKHFLICSLDNNKDFEIIYIKSKKKQIKQLMILKRIENTRLIFIILIM